MQTKYLPYNAHQLAVRKSISKHVHALQRRPNLFDALLLNMDLRNAFIEALLLYEFTIFVYLRAPEMSLEWCSVENTIFLDVSRDAALPSKQSKAMRTKPIANSMHVRYRRPESASRVDCRLCLVRGCESGMHPETGVRQERSENHVHSTAKGCAAWP